MLTPTLNRRREGSVGRFTPVMVKHLVPAEVDLNSAGADFWRRYHAFRRARHAETRPDDPIEPDEVVARRMRMGRKFQTDVYHEVARDGVMIGWLHGHTVSPGAPGYETNRDFFQADG